MSSRIWKFTLAGGEANMFHALLPVRAKALSADWEAGHFVVWAIFDFDNAHKTERRWFHIAGTGHEMQDGARGIPLLNRIDIPGTGQFGEKTMLRFHAFDGGWNPDEEKN